MLFGLFESLFGIFLLSILANRPLFAAPREKKSTQKVFLTKAEIKSKQLLKRRKAMICYYKESDISKFAKSQKTKNGACLGAACSLPLGVEDPIIKRRLACR